MITELPNLLGMFVELLGILMMCECFVSLSYFINLGLYLSSCDTVERYSHFLFLWGRKVD